MTCDGDQVAAGALKIGELLVEFFEVSVGFGLDEGDAELIGDRLTQHHFIVTPTMAAVVIKV